MSHAPAPGSASGSASGSGGTENVFGLLAEFEEPEQLLEAARRTTAAGYKRAEAYSPYPVEGLAEALDFHRTRLPLVVLLGGVLGGVGAYALQTWSSAIHYPLNIGGRPPYSWPMFISVTFECTVLVAALFCVLGMLALNGLPRPYHPLFDVEGFERASSDRFFLLLMSTDPKFEGTEVRRFLESLGPLKVSDVPQKR